MPWIKRNLYFFITLIAGVGVTGYCGYLLFGAMSEAAAASAKYGSDKSSLDTLQKSTPYPDKDNIEAAEKDAARVRGFLADFHKAFATFPGVPKMDEHQFNDYLKKSISQFSLEATNAGVGFPAGYSWTWSQWTDKLDYPSESIEPWLQELEEIHAILRVLCTAKINYLENIKRPAVTGEDAAGEDYMRLGVVSNQWGTVTPYMVSFRGFSTQVASFLADFAASSHCFVVKAIYVTPSMVPLPALPEPEPPPQMLAPQLMRQPPVNMYRGPYGMGEERYGRGGDPSMRGMMRPRQYLQMQQLPIEMPAAPTGPETVLSEKPLFVTAYIDVVKLKPVEVPKPAAAPPMSGRPRRPGPVRPVPAPVPAPAP